MTKEEQLYWTSPTNPLVVTNAKDYQIQFYDIHTPFMIMLETCHEAENLYSVYQFTQSNYQSSVFSKDNFKFVKDRPLHQHSCIEIMYVLSGSVTNHVENQVFTYEAGQCCIMNKNIRHCEDFSGEFQVVFFMLQDDFTSDLLKDHLDVMEHHEEPDEENLIFQLIADGKKEMLKFDKVYLDCFPMISADKILEILSPLFNSILKETIDWKAGSSFYIKGAFARVLQIMSDPTLFSINRIHSNSRSQEYLFSKISHIMRSSHGRCTREDLSTQLHYNGEYLNRIIKKYTGMTLLEYGQSIYLEEARKLLADTEKSISSIIEELGFSNRSHFYRLFEKYYGETPMNYRKRIHNKQK
ncbi:MAG: AraC family transcriptional regulator [Dorea sp.]|nr:AraC family transcriptional regulator [Dorea sp.]MDY2813928.1 AraC family transcriptional regulator [Dorea sp.]